MCATCTAHQMLLALMRVKMMAAALARTSERAVLRESAQEVLMSVLSTAATLVRCTALRAVPE
jgi:hypothetical protein